MPNLDDYELAFDRAAVDHTVNSIDSATIRPRYQSDLFEPDDLAALDAKVDPLEASPSVLVYDPRTADVQCLSPAAHALLERCDGTRSPDEVVADVPPEHRTAARGFLRELARSGLLVASPDADALRAEAATTTLAPAAAATRPSSDPSEAERPAETPR